MLIALLACTEPLPPETPSILLGPTDPTTAEDLIATVIDPVTDPNGDDVTLVWRWFRDQIEVPEANSKVLPADLTARGESWMVRVYASDGDLDSDSATASVTVVNTVPAVSLELPSEAFSSEDLVAVATVEDPDNDDLDLSWEWTVDGAPSSVVGASVDADQTQRGEVWTVSLTASDGEADDTATATVSVVNAPPEVTELTLSPEEPRTGDGLEATLATIDADGDPVTVTWSWTLDGVVLEDEEGDTLEGDYTKGQAVAVHALPTDGEDEGDLATAEVVIANTPPTVAAANLDPNDVYETSTVSCVGVSWSDPD
ncbi:MAG TPA: hypothetical protein QGF58_29340, partial [Myxococcota bacterium]|nr:hypothetical protein [Myxococcota bacterium]